MSNNKGLLVVPIMIIGIAALGAIPGAIIGAITGLFGFHLPAAIILGILIFSTYPRSRRKWGSEPDLLTYFIGLCGASVTGFACYFVGGLVR